MSEFERLHEIIRRVVWDDPTWELLEGAEEAVSGAPAIRALLQVAKTEEEQGLADALISQVAVQVMHDHQAFRRLLALGVEEGICTR